MVFLHGLGASHKQYLPQVEALKDRYHLIIPDLRGNGRSSVLDMPVEDVLSTQAEDISRLLNDLQVESCWIVGVSYGGVLAYRIALDSPELVRGLIICDSFSDSVPQDFIEKLNMQLIRISLPLYHARGLLAWSLGNAYRKWPIARDFFINAMKKLRSKEITLQRKAINEVNYTDEIKKIKIPVLGIVGEKAAILVRSMRRSMEELNHSELVILPDSIDPSNLCRVQEFNELVDDFIRDNDD